MNNNSKFSTVILRMLWLSSLFQFKKKKTIEADVTIGESEIAKPRNPENTLNCPERMPKREGFSPESPKLRAKMQVQKISTILSK